MTTNYEIRLLTNDDKDNLNSLIENVETTIKKKVYWLPISETSREHFFDKEWTILWGMYDGNELVGSIGLFLNENEYGESQREVQLEDKKIAEVGRIMCRSNYRGKGIASRLMEVLLEYVNELDIDLLLATVHPDNEPSQKLVK